MKYMYLKFQDEDETLLISIDVQFIIENNDNKKILFTISNLIQICLNLKNKIL